MLKDRQKSILGAAIEAYVRTARPVASQELARAFHFGLSPATLRNELNRLDELGYMEQPHTSAGRVPTDRGYRFFVDHMMEEEELGTGERELLDAAFALREEEKFVRELTRVVSHISGMFAVSGLSDDALVYGTGFSEVLEEPEFEDHARMRAFGRLADMADEQIRRMMPAFDQDNEARVFIGRENPWKEARDYAMAFSFWHHPRGFRGFVTMIGPRRTNYQKNKAILEAVQSYE